MSTFRDGERISAATNVGGMFGSSVRRGEFGTVVRTEHGLFDEKVIVRFDNGRTETVKSNEIKRESGWF